MKTSPADSSPKTRILVVDDHPLVRKGMVNLINRQEDLECCGEADTPAALFAAMTQWNPDLVLQDLCLGDSDGLELIKSFHARFPNLPVLVLSQSDENLFAERALRAGARGYISKLSPSQDVLAAIRSVASGELYLSRSLTMTLLRKAIQSEPETAPPVVGTLSDREMHVFQLLGRGLSTRAIAMQLDLSLKTIEAHRENIKHKLGFTNAVMLVQAATQWVQNNATPLTDSAPVQSAAAAHASL